MLFIVSTQLNGFKNCGQILIILFDINHLLAYLNDFKYSRWLNNFIWHIDWTLTGTTRVDLEVMAFKGYSTFSRGPKLEPYSEHLAGVSYHSA